MKDWSYFDKFQEVVDRYMPVRGEGDTMASQTVTAVNKLIYKWYNDGDVFDNTHGMNGWANDLSSYANWLARWVRCTANCLYGIKYCKNDGDYEDLLAKLADQTLDEGLLAALDKIKAHGTIYDCEGHFKFVEPDEDEDDCDDCDETEDEDED